MSASGARSRVNLVPIDLQCLRIARVFYLTDRELPVTAFPLTTLAPCIPADLWIP